MKKYFICILAIVMTLSTTSVIANAQERGSTVSVTSTEENIGRIMEVSVTEPKLGGVPTFNVIKNLPKEVVPIFSVWMHSKDNETYMTSSDPTANEELTKRGISPVTFNETGEYKYKMLFTIKEQNKEKFKAAFEGLKIRINGVPHELVLDYDQTIASVEVTYKIESTLKEEENPPVLPESPDVNERNVIDIKVTEPKFGEVPTFNEIEGLPKEVVPMFSIWKHIAENGTYSMTSNDPASNEGLAKKGISPVTFNEAGEYKYKVLFTIKEQNKEKFKEVFKNLKVRVNGVPHELVLDYDQTIASVEVTYKIENVAKEENKPESPDKPKEIEKQDSSLVQLNNTGKSNLNVDKNNNFDKTSNLKVDVRESKDYKLPKTGDSSDILGYSIFAFGSLLILIFSVFARKKNKMM
ncbi:LPXTG cell wall anchor domain-containing protein [Peptostreptococcus porci]|uniref:LPXTG cell wall anchor domain-containing protein n=1 Tax=Peptostreptococcus porci TaxID=2652282 RepID=UPI002A7FD960|nr:LPXTG cell wall anchor domain-containing protein [Peptostreptococcus porci]MDY4129025.1 LPXTG cell wall anchor domain-containing protein [Peptostreptococcus porci]